MSRYVIFNLSVELLEDLHTGNGMGDACGIDSVQTRDSRGGFIIRATHLKGVLREQAELLQQMGALPANAPIDRLFGKDFTQRGELQLSTLQAAGDRSADAIVVASTAREINSRLPKEDTLRIYEFAPAGLKFHGQALLPEEMADLFQSAIRATMFLGSSRTRGAGRVRIELGAGEQEKRDIPDMGGQGKILRILLENLEPLSLPAYEQSGQLIQSENFIRGQRLRAAFADWWTTRQTPGTSDPPPILAPSVRVTDGLCVASSQDDIAPTGGGDISSLLQKVQAIPLPLSIYSPKPPAQAGNLPWWEDSEKNSGGMDVDVSQVGLVPEGYKRPKTDDVLVSTRDGWIRFHPAIQVHLRNRVPDRHSRKGKAELYAEEELAGNQIFLADLHFPEQSAAQEFIRAHAPLFNRSSWLRIGGGGRPVRIVSFTLTDPSPNGGADPDSLRIVLVSDLILRSANLNFAARLTPDILAEELKVGLDGVFLSDSRSRTICETRMIFGWNGVTRRQRARALAIRRGSVFSFTGPGVGKLREALRERLALGERQEEGFGRFVLDPVFAWAAETGSGFSPQPNLTERLIGKADDICQSAAASFQKLSTSQWQWLRQLTHGGLQDWPAIRSKLETHAAKRAGAPWKAVMRVLDSAFANVEAADQKELAGHIALRMILEARKPGKETD